jgi:hypothetical protein
VRVRFPPWALLKILSFLESFLIEFCGRMKTLKCDKCMEFRELCLSAEITGNNSNIYDWFVGVHPVRFLPVRSFSEGGPSLVTNIKTLLLEEFLF